MKYNIDVNPAASGIVLGTATGALADVCLWAYFGMPPGGPGGFPFAASGAATGFAVGLYRAHKRNSQSEENQDNTRVELR